MTNVRLLYSTTPNIELAQSISRQLLKEELIACANVIPKMHSIYKWDGEVQEEQECVLILKTVEKNISKIMERVQTLHSYDCPCLLVLDVSGGHQAYLDWVAELTSAE